MNDISGTPWEIEAIAHLLRGRRAAPVFIDYSPGNYTRYSLCIVPCRASHILSVHPHLREADYYVTWVGHGSFTLMRNTLVTAAWLEHQMVGGRIHDADATVLATFFSRILSTPVTNAPTNDPSWSAGDAPRT